MTKETTRAFINYITTDGDYTVDDFKVCLEMKSEAKPRIGVLMRELTENEVEMLEANEADSDWRVFLC